VAYSVKSTNELRTQAATLAKQNVLSRTEIGIYLSWVYPELGRKRKEVMSRMGFKLIYHLLKKYR